MEKMGYDGGGLGKNGNGMVDALAVQTSEKTMIFSSSITKGISKHGFNKSYKGGHAKFQRYPGGNIRHIKTYLPAHLSF